MGSLWRQRVPDFHTRPYSDCVSLLQELEIKRKGPKNERNRSPFNLFPGGDTQSIFVGLLQLLIVGEFVAASFNVSNATLDEMCSTNRDCKCRLSDLSAPPSSSRATRQMLSVAVWHRAPELMKMHSSMEEELMTFYKSRRASIFSVRGPSPLLPTLSWYEGPGKVPLWF